MDRSLEGCTVKCMTYRNHPVGIAVAAAVVAGETAGQGRRRACGSSFELDQQEGSSCERQPDQDVPTGTIEESTR